jgi:hypothetical protein
MSADCRIRGGNAVVDILNQALLCHAVEELLNTSNADEL